MYMLNMVIILIVMYCNVVTAIDKIPTYLLRFNMHIFTKLDIRWGTTMYGSKKEMNTRQHLK